MRLKRILVAYVAIVGIVASIATSCSDEIVETDGEADATITNCILDKSGRPMAILEISNSTSQTVSYLVTIVFRDAEYARRSSDVRVPEVGPHEITVATVTTRESVAWPQNELTCQLDGVVRKPD